MSAETTDLQFDFNIESFRQWLYDLYEKEREVRYSNLLSGLKLLNSAKPEPRFHYQALVEASVSAFKAASNLSNLVVGKSFPLATSQRKLAKLGLQFYGELIRGFSRMIEEDDFAQSFSPEEQALAVHAALKALNRMFVGMALMYDAPPSSHWLLLNELYCWAERKGLQDWQTNCFNLIPNHTVSIHDLYLSSLTLRIIVPYHLQQKEMIAVFDFIQQEGELIQISRQHAPPNSALADYAINLESSSPPIKLSSQPQLPNGDWRFLHYRALRAKLDTSGRVAPLKDLIPPHLRKYLMVRLGTSLRPLAEKRARSSLLVSGFKELVEILPSVGTHLDSLGALGDLKLLTLEDESDPFAEPAISKSSGTFQRYNQGLPTILPNEKSQAGKNGILCKVSPADTPGFLIVQPPNVSLPTESLVGLFTDDKLMQFGVLYPDSGVIEQNVYGFELLATNVELARVSFEQHSKKLYQCFYSTLQGSKVSLITPHLRLKIGDTLVLDRLGYGEKKERFFISRQFIKHQDFCLYELAPESGRQA